MTLQRREKWSTATARSLMPRSNILVRDEQVARAVDFTSGKIGRYGVAGVQLEARKLKNRPEKLPSSSAS